MSKEPASRFETTSDLADALWSIQDIPSGPPSLNPQKCQSFFDQVIDDLQPENVWFSDGLECAPYCSVHSGMAGIAYALLRISSALKNPQLLALADLWLNKTMGALDTAEAFYSEEHDLGQQTIGRISPYHTASGVFLVQSLLADSTGTIMEADWAKKMYLQEIKKTDIQANNRDLTLGRLGTVLGCAILLDKSQEKDSEHVENIKRYGHATINDLWNHVRAFDSIKTGRSWANVGIAHGWAGLLYTTLRWHLCSGYVIPDDFRKRYAELQRCAYPEARGLSWPWRAENGGEKTTMPGWCNGAAGMVHLGTLAYQIFGEEDYIKMAQGAAWHAWEAPGSSLDLCCGLAGRSYALLNLYQCTGETAWLQRAKELMRKAVTAGTVYPDNARHSLFKGELGLAVLIAELETPENASMPMFGVEV